MAFWDRSAFSLSICPLSLSLSLFLPSGILHSSAITLINWSASQLSSRSLRNGRSTSWSSWASGPRMNMQDMVYLRVVLRCILRARQKEKETLTVVCLLFSLSFSPSRSFMQPMRTFQGTVPAHVRDWIGRHLSQWETGHAEKELTPLSPPSPDIPQSSVCAYTSCEKHNWLLKNVPN